MIINFPIFRKFLKASLIFQISLLFLWGCESSNYQNFQGPAQGTEYHITARLPKGIAREQVQQVIDRTLADVDISLSTYRQDSEISKFNTLPAGISVDVSQEFIDVINVSREVYRQSSGAFNPSVNDLVRLWGFGKEISIEQYRQVPDEKSIQLAKTTMNFESVQNEGLKIRKVLPVKLDFNGVAQGYTTDAIAKALQTLNINHYMVEVGGELATRGVSPRGSVWRIGVEMPGEIHADRRKKVFAALLLNDANLATSGDYRDYYEIDGKRYSHTIDPVSGFPVNHKLASVTVLAKTAGHADAWATAFMVLGEDAGFRLAEKLDIAAYFIYRNQDVFDVKVTSAMQAYIEH